MATNVSLEEPVAPEEPHQPGTTAAPAPVPVSAPPPASDEAGNSGPGSELPATAGDGHSEGAGAPAEASAAPPTVTARDLASGSTETTSAGTTPDTQAAPAATNTTETADTAAAEPPAEPSGHLFLLGVDVPPGTSTRLAWAPKQSFEGIYIATPVLVVNGHEPGPTLCLTAAIHGDELNGIETVRRVLYNLEPERLKGAVIGVPIVNLQGFHASSRYLSDRRDLNRYFPGDPGGSSASRIAYSFFHEVIQHCSAVVDLHTGSFYRTNLPQLRGDLSKPEVVDLTRGFGSTVVLHSEGAEGTLRHAAVAAGIPAVTLEAGGPSVLEETAVGHSVKGVRTLLNHLGMTSRFSLWGDPEPVYYNSVWQRAPVGGIVFSRVSLGQNVREGEVLGTVTNPITNVRTRIVSSHTGRVIGMALNQVVQPGFATHHIGIAAPRGQVPEELVDEQEAQTELSTTSGDAASSPEATENGNHIELSADDESDEGGPLADD
ncbi:MAG: succinylglutamate desuccinylase [Haliea sp.]|nr:succinylglutamate desuccinylase [Haliea sp.]